jgi:hypothetical protein
MSIVSSGNNPDKKFYKFTGKFNDEANMCTIMTTIGMKLKIAPIIPPNKTPITTEDHKRVTLNFSMVSLSIYWLFGANYRGRSCFKVKFCYICSKGAVELLKRF